jgi:hypothetical protein
VEKQPKHSCSAFPSSSSRLRVQLIRGGSAAACAAVMACASLMLGCGDSLEEQVDECISTSISEGRRVNWIQGQWRFTGTGERENCSNETLNADSFDLASGGIRVHQQGHFVFLEGTRSDFALTGMVGNNCIHFKTVERLPSGAVVSYDFPAFFQTRSNFKGEFKGSGPERCTTKGDFTVYANLDSIPVSAGNNPAPADAGVGQQQLCADCKTSCDQIDPAYFAACKGGCDQYVCKEPAAEAGSDADAADALDAPTEHTEDGPQEAATDAPSDSEETDAEDASVDGETDASMDVQGDVEGGDGETEDGSTELDGGDGGLTSDAADSGNLDAADGGKADAADAGRPDAKLDAQVDSSDLEYDFWSGAASDAKKAADSAGLCSARSGPAGGESGIAGSITIACAAVVLARRRRKSRSDRKSA